MSIDLRKCPLAKSAFPFGCDWCGRPLRSRQSRWCNDTCAKRFLSNHYWNYAREAALKRDGYKCVRCGKRTTLEVNHIYPLSASTRRKDPYKPSCLHHLSGLETLCHAHHQEATAKQRADGLIVVRKRKRRKQ